MFFEAGEACSHNRVWGNIVGARQAYVSNAVPFDSLLDVCDRNVYQTSTFASLRWKSAAADLASWQAKLGLDRRSLAANPGFVDASCEDLHLRPASPCIDRSMPVARAATAGADSDLLAVRSEGRYSRVARKLSDKPGAAPATEEVLRLPFEPGDAVIVGTGRATRTAIVLAVVDDTHLKLDRKISWREGDWVTFPYRGDAPDAGAYESGDDQRIIGPSWKAYPHRDFAR